MTIEVYEFAYMFRCLDCNVIIECPVYSDGHFRTPIKCIICDSQRVIYKSMLKVHNYETRLSQINHDKDIVPTHFVIREVV